jgi:hypothetical protein
LASGRGPAWVYARTGGLIIGTLSGSKVLRVSCSSGYEIIIAALFAVSTFSAFSKPALGRSFRKMVALASFAFFVCSNYSLDLIPDALVAWPMQGLYCVYGRFGFSDSSKS